MKKKKIFLVLVAVIVATFTISGVETVREEMADRKLQKSVLEEKCICEDVFKPYLNEKTKRSDVCICTEKVAKCNRSYPIPRK